MRAVAQFATARNNERHDRQWGLPQAPNPNKEVGALYNIGAHSAYLIGKITFPRSKFSTYLEGPFQKVFDNIDFVLVTLKCDDGDGNGKVKKAISQDDLRLAK